MGIFDLMEKYGHEELIFCYHSSSGLRAVIGIHDTTLGPAIGGTRMWGYNTEAEAVMDVLQLSRSMTFQTSIVDCDNGSGKAVIWGDPRTEKEEALLRAFGRFVEGFGGRFITYPDLGTSTRDMKYVRRETSYITPLEEMYAASGDSSEITAYGVYWGMKACCRALFGSESLKGLTVAVQGVGEVGSRLVDFAMEEECSVVVTDINYDAVKRIQDRHNTVKVVRPEEILSFPCDVLAPCALGGVINDETIDTLQCKIIAGAAYNLVTDDRLADMLHERGILLAPDFVISAGELFQATDRLRVVTKEEAFTRAKEIYRIMEDILTLSQKTSEPPYRVACRLAEERITKVGKVKSIMCHRRLRGDSGRR
jgi:leucine dehydrogenase